MSKPLIRNPSPPRDGEGREEAEALASDAIGGTAYSKQWLFSTLLKLLRQVEGLHRDALDPSETSEPGEGNSLKDPKKETTAGIESTAETESTEDSASSFVAEIAEAKNGKSDKPTEVPEDEPNGPPPPSSSLSDSKAVALISPSDGNSRAAPSLAGEKIDEETEAELCSLWDMTSEPDVVKLLLEYNAIDLLVGAIYKSVGVEPRYTEIAVGILGNMACQREACAVMAAETKVMELIYWILQISTDAPLLVETTRLVTTIFDSISEQETTPWIETLYGRCIIKKPILPLIEDRTVLSTVSSSESQAAQIVKPDPDTTPSISKNIEFILQSSTRLDLLRNVLKFLDQIFECERAADLVSALMHMWVVEYELVEGLLECWKVIHDEHENPDAIDSWIHVMYLICQTCDMETRRSDRSSVSLKVGIIGKLPPQAAAILRPVAQYLRWCLEAEELQTKWFISIACSYNIAQALLVHSMTSLEIIEVAVKVFHRILVKWPIGDLKRRLRIKDRDRDRNRVMTDKLLKYTFDSVFGFFSFVFARIIRDRDSPIIQNVVRTFERCPMAALKSMSELLDTWHRDEATLNQVSPLNPGIGAFESSANPLPEPRKCETTVAEVIGEMLKVAEERGTKKLALVISSTATATTYTSTTVNTLGNL